MCIAIMLPPHSKLASDIQKSTLRCCWNNNSDGAGFMYVDNSSGEGVLRVYKGFFKFKKFYCAFRSKRQAHPNSVFGIHLRIASRGSRDMPNCHPHIVKNDKIAIIHNGTILNDTIRNKGDSDTVVFVRDILSKLPDGWYNNDAYRYLIEYYIGSGKIMLLDSDNKVVLYNKDLWIEDTGTGILYSNQSYRSSMDGSVNIVKHGQAAQDYANDAYEDDLCSAISSLPQDERCVRCSELLLHRFEHDLGICFACASEDELKHLDDTYGPIKCGLCKTDIMPSSPERYDLGVCKSCCEKEDTNAGKIGQRSSIISPDFCEECGIELLSYTEQKTGLCNDCLDRRDKRVLSLQQPYETP